MGIDCRFGYVDWFVWGVCVICVLLFGMLVLCWICIGLFYVMLYSVFCLRCWWMVCLVGYCLVFVFTAGWWLIMRALCSFFGVLNSLWFVCL